MRNPLARLWYLLLLLLSAASVVIGLWPSPLTLFALPPARARVVFDVEDGRPRRLTAWHREFAIPSTGIAYTQYSADQGWYRPATPHPLRVRIVNAGGDTVPAAGEWLRGGFVRTAGCEFQYDEYAVWSAASPRPDSGALAPVNWLDSLPQWGVDCVDGRLRRSQGRRRTEFPVPGQVCYYEIGGGMACHVGRHSAP